MQRRGFLGSLMAGALCPRISWADVGNPAFLAAALHRDGHHRLHGISLQGTSLFALPLPARGHAAAAHPQRPLAVGFARRPGRFALVIDCAAGREVARLTPPEGLHFNGHGAFSSDGSILYTSEQRADTSEGRLGLWQVEGWRRVAEIPTHGIGPHDIRRLPLSEDLLVANGGIATDPTDRTKLNLDTMRPNLPRITPEGRLVSRAELPPGMAQNSLRHLALLPDGRAACALQWEGDPAEAPPLLALWEAGQLTLCPAPEAEAFAMQNYAGSIAASQGRIALTSPRGGVVQVFGFDGAFQQTLRRPDASGIAATPDGFLLTDGHGVLSHLTDKLRPGPAAPVQWDNHLIALA